MERRAIPSKIRNLKLRAAVGPMLLALQMPSVLPGHLEAATLFAADELTAIADDTSVRFFQLGMFPSAVTQVGPAFSIAGEATVTLAVCCGLYRPDGKAAGGLNAIIDNDSVRFLIVTMGQGSSVTQVGPAITTRKKATLTPAGDLQALADDGSVRFFRLAIYPSAAVAQVGPAIVTAGQATVVLAPCCGLKATGLNAIVDNTSVRFFLITTSAQSSAVTQVGPAIPIVKH